MTTAESRIRSSLRRTVEIARKDGLDEETISRAIAGALFEVKAVGYRPKERTTPLTAHTTQRKE